MTELEQQIAGVISAAGDSKGRTSEALRRVRESDYEGIRILPEESRKINLEAHKIQTKLIQSEIDPEAEKPGLPLLVAHAQDHYMTSQLARDVIEALVDAFEAKEGGNQHEDFITLCRWLFHQCVDAEHERGRKGKHKAE